MLRKVFTAVCLVALAGALSACGQKGPLVLPDTAHAGDTAPIASLQAAPAAAPKTVS